MADAATLGILIRLKDEATGPMAQMDKALQANRKQWQAHAATLRTAGFALAGIGAAFTAMAALSVKAAQEEAVGISRLDASLQTVGLGYEGLRKPIEDVIAAQQRLTNFSDGEQRAALQRLITISQDYAASMEALPTVLDVAAGGAMDLQAAALLIGKALAGETSTLKRYGIVLEEGASRTEILTALTKQFGGAAQAAANPFTQLKNVVNDLKETMGAQLLPVVQSIVSDLTGLLSWVTRLASEHPLLTKVIMLNAAAFGVLAVAAGAFLLVLPSLTAGLAVLGISFSAALGPIGLIALAITGVVTAYAVLSSKSDEAAGRVSAATTKMQADTQAASASMEKANKEQLDEAKKGIDALGDAVVKALENRYAQEAALRATSLEDQKAAWEAAAAANDSSTRAAIENANELARADVEAAREAAQGRIDNLAEVLRARLDSISQEQEAVRRGADADLRTLRRAHSARLQAIGDELNAQLDALAAVADARMGAANEELRALDGEREALDKAAQARGDVEKRAQLEGDITAAKDLEAAKARERQHFLDVMNSVEDVKQRQAAADSALAAQNKMQQAAQDRAEAEAALARWLLGIDERTQRESIDAKRRAVQDRMSAIRTEQQAAADSLRDQAEAARRHENELNTTREDGIRDRLQATQDGLQAEMDRQRETFARLEAAERGNLAASLGSIETRRAARENELTTEGRIFGQMAAQEMAALDRSLEANKANLKALNDAVETAAFEMLDHARENNDDMIALLAEYNPLWQDAGQTWGDKLLEGLNSRKTAIDAAIADILNRLTLASDLTKPIQGPPAPVEGGGPIVGPPPPGNANPITGLGPGGVPGVPPFIPIIPPKLASGGLVMRPTLAVVGERGPEAVIPISRSNGGVLGGNTIVLHYHQEAPVYGMEDFQRQVAQAVRDTKLAGGFHGIL